MTGVTERNPYSIAPTIHISKDADIKGLRIQDITQEFAGEEVTVALGER